MTDDYPMYLVFIVVVGVFVLTAVNASMQPDPSSYTGSTGCLICSCESQKIIKINVEIIPQQAGVKFPARVSGSGVFVNSTWCGGSMSNITDENGSVNIPVYSSKEYTFSIQNETINNEERFYPRGNEYTIVVLSGEIP